MALPLLHTAWPVSCSESCELSWKSKLPLLRPAAKTTAGSAMVLLGLQTMHCFLCGNQLHWKIALPSDMAWSWKCAKYDCNKCARLAQSVMSNWPVEQSILEQPLCRHRTRAVAVLIGAGSITGQMYIRSPQSKSTKVHVHMHNMLHSRSGPSIVC